MIKTFTVWRFSSPSTDESRVVAKVSEPGDRKAQHDFQRVLWQGNAESAEEAMAQWTRSQAPSPATDLERDAARWRKLEALLRAADENPDLDLDGLALNVGTLAGWLNVRKVEVGMTFNTLRDEEIDLGSVIDATPWPEPTSDAAVKP